MVLWGIPSSTPSDCRLLFFNLKNLLLLEEITALPYPDPTRILYWNTRWELGLTFAASFMVIFSCNTFVSIKKKNFINLFMNIKLRFLIKYPWHQCLATSLTAMEWIKKNLHCMPFFSCNAKKNGAQVHWHILLKC